MEHLPYDVLEHGIRSLPPPPRDEGRVALVVARPQSGLRDTPERVMLTAQGGVSGDRWSHRASLNRECQITVMRVDVARLIANGQPLSLFGDNLIVEMDISEENLPAGTRLRIGDALCEVTPKPHTGCGKFAERFGQDARDVANAPELASWRLRGMHVSVVEDGEVSPGDSVRVVFRPGP